MKKLWILAFLLGSVAAAWAGTPDLPAKVHPPYFLQAKDKLPLSDLACPDVDLQGPDGQPLDEEVNIQPPDPGDMDLLSDPALFEEVQRQKPSETTLQKFYWHMVDEVEYCHFKDLEGNHWYGWEGKDEGFNWVLWRGHRYWWHDSFADHWLYYFQGVWWRADGQKKNSIQADIDGEYYACDAQGHVLGDMGQEGNGDIVSAPGHYQGDSRQGGHGGHGGHAGHSGGGQGNPNGGQNAPPAGGQGAGQNSNSAPAPSGSSNNSPSNPPPGH